jgi:hypothetical protein
MNQKKTTGSSFVDYESSYETDESGALSTSRYWKILEEEYKNLHPYEQWWKDLPPSNREQ